MNEAFSARSSFLVRVAWVCGALALLVSLVVAGLRVAFNLSIFEPLQTFTSGFEEESVFAIWKWVHGQPIYSDPLRVPFAASYFNWIFYVFYGVLTKLLIGVSSLQDEWITQIGKWITLAGSLVLGAGCFRILRIVDTQSQESKSSLLPVVWLGVSAYIAFSPHVGFWCITTRPDVWALAMEVLALGSYLRSLKTQVKADLLWFLLFSYAAWGFKHANVTFAGACILDCLLRRHFRLAIMLAMALLCAFAVTLVAGTEVYRYMLLKSQAPLGFSLGLGIKNLGSALAKSPFAWVPWLVSLFWSRNAFLGSNTAPHNGCVRVLHLTAALAFAFYLPLAFKVGASDNYYLPFTTSAMLAWVCVCRRTFNRPLAFAVILGAVGCTVGCLAVLSGKRGTLDVSHQNRELIVIKSCLANLPRPVLAWNNLASLPWINTSAEKHFVLATVYSFLPTEKYEAGGVEGLIATGYFASVLDPRDQHRELCEKYLQKVEMTNCPGAVYVRTNLWPRRSP